MVDKLFSAYTGWRNVKDFGATGNGSTDDRAAIQAAVDWTSGGDRGVIFFPPGTYKVNAPVTFNYNLGELSIIFRGVGGLSTITGNFADYLLKRDLGTGNPTSGGRVVENLNFFNSNAAGGCLRIGSTIMGAVRNCNLRGFRCLNLTDTDTNTSQLTVDGCSFSSSGIPNAIGIIVGQHATITECDVTGLFVGIRAYGVGVNIMGSRFEVNGTGIELGPDETGSNHSLSGFSIIGCSFESNGTAIDFAGAAGHGLIAGIIIQGFEGAGPFGSNPQYGIRTRGDNCGFTQFSSITAGGQIEVACYSVGNTTNRNGIVFNGCHGSNSSTLGGVVWQLPATAHTAEFINCDANPTYLFGNLPSGVNRRESDKYYITDGNQATLGAAVTAGSGSNRGWVTWNGSNWTLMSK